MPPFALRKLVIPLIAATTAMLIGTTMLGVTAIASPLPTQPATPLVTTSVTAVVVVPPAPLTSPVPATPVSPCIDSVDSLPASALYRRADRRLRNRTLVVVLKAKRRLMLFHNGKSLRQNCWQVGLGTGAIAGTKAREGDLKTPEGWYRSSDKPWSSFRGAIAIHYPNRLDARRGLRTGLINRATYNRINRALSRGVKPPQHTRLGGEVLIHGGGGTSDWTLGCVALDDDRLAALRKALPRHKRVNVLILP